MRSSVGLPPFFTCEVRKCRCRSVWSGSASYFVSRSRRADFTVVGGCDVVEQRRRAGEALVPHQLLGVDPAVGLAEGDVALPGDLAQRVIDRHSSILGHD